MPPTIYITDCYDDNTKARQTARIQSLIPEVHSVQFVAIKTGLEAAGNIVDVLDALEGRPGIIFANVAPRGTGRWPNGTPFCHTQYQNAHIFSTFEGGAFSLLRKLTGENIQVHLFDIPSVVENFPLSLATKEYIARSQFRSFDFLPRVAAAVLSGTAIPSTAEHVAEECPKAIWWQDNFGNFKTTLLPEEVGFEPGKIITLAIGSRMQAFHCFSGLKDIPAGEIGLYVGSSGLPGKRLLEFSRQKGDALAHEHAASLPYVVGDAIAVV